MRSYPCVIVGLPYEGRARYVARSVKIGDEITLRLEPDNLHNPDAVACYHAKQHIGYIPSRKGWVGRSIKEGDTHQIVVTGFDTNDEGELSCVEIEIAIVEDGHPRQERPVVRSIVSEIGQELRILCMVAAADGRIQAPEREVIEQFSELRARDLGLEPDEGEAAYALRWARRKVPNGLDAARIIGALSIDRPDALPGLLEMIEIVAGMDNSIRVSELETIEKLRGLIDVGTRIRNH